MADDAAEARLAGIRELWSDGDYARVGALFVPVTDALVDELDLGGLEVLDAATGTGNTALAAARAGARVSAFDLTPRLLEIARARAAEADLAIDFVEGDLLDIPYPDDRFDVVVSTFGAFTADDPRRCATELVRVCRPGGRVVSTAWAQGGIFGVLTTIVADRHPELMDPDRPDPRAWADAEGLAEIFTGLDVDIELTHRTAWFTFASAEQAVALFEEVSGPVQRLRAAVEGVSEGGWRDVREALVHRLDALARPVPAGVELPSQFGIAVVRVR